MTVPTLSEANAALLERLYEFGQPLPALFVFSREALNELMDAARSEGPFPPRVSVEADKEALIEQQAREIESYRAALREIRDLKSEPIGDTGFAVGSASLLRRAQVIARTMKVGRSSAALQHNGGK